jgi:hypothetical protein
MKTTAGTRITAALLSATMTLFLLQAVSHYGYPPQNSTDAQIAGSSTITIATASK